MVWDASNRFLKSRITDRRFWSELDAIRIFTFKGEGFKYLEDSEIRREVVKNANLGYVLLYGVLICIHIRVGDRIKIKTFTMLIKIIRKVILSLWNLHRHASSKLDLSFTKTRHISILHLMVIGLKLQPMNE